MPRTSPFTIELSDQERTVLEARPAVHVAVSGCRTGQDGAHGGRGLDNDEIATRLDTRHEVVSKWRKR